MNNSQNEKNEKKITEPIEFFDTPQIQSPTEIAGMAGYLKTLHSQPNAKMWQPCSPTELKYLFAATENNDIACAGMIYQIIGDNVIYSGQCYYIWNGYIWSEISKEILKHCVISILESRLNYVRSLKEYESLDYVESCCNNGKINSITSILQTYILKDPRLLNNDRGLLCVRNGVIDFETRRLLPHYVYKENYLTAMVDIDYEPGFRHPLFDNFIYSIMDGDVDKITYIQSVFGYALLGCPREQLCFVFKGNGANGKTTLIDAVNAVLTHNYCCTVPKNIITHENNRDINASSSTTAQLNGKRIVFTSELRKTDKIAEAIFKKLIGGGRIVAREVYKQTIEFDMRATLIIDSNYLPAIANADDDEGYAIKRRMSIIPFNHRFKPEERDVDLPQKLSDPQVQKAIMSWILDGVWIYLDFGLIPTLEMQHELDSYMLTENSLTQFFADCIVNTDNPNDFIGTTELYNKYVNYCNLKNLMPITAQKFAFAHNGVLINDKELKRKYKLPKTKIETDSYVAVQMIESVKKLDFDSVKFMAERVEGSFSFSILDAYNNLWLIKGDNPLHILKLPKEKIYVYASTEEILWRALIETELFGSIKSGSYEQVKISGWDILRILADGELEYAKFNYTDYSEFSYCNWWNYGTDYDTDKKYNNIYIEDLKSIAAYQGILPEDIDVLLAQGFTIDEIEEYIYCCE